MPPVWFYDLMYRWRAPWEVSARSELVALVGSGRVCWRYVCVGMNPPVMAALNGDVDSGWRAAG